MIRSVLYVPGDQPEMLAKAGTRGADLVLIDLEDSVAHASKEAARKAATEAMRELEGAGTGVGIRLNSNPVELDLDLAVVDLTRAGAVQVPKATKASVEGVVDRLPDGVPIIALIEDAQGLLDAAAIARHPGVERLAIGEQDLAADLGADPDAPGLQVPARAQVTWASAAAGMPGPIGPVYTALGDLEGMRAIAHELRAVGFAGMAAIHPAQVPLINEVFTPTQEELAEARRIIAAYKAANAEGKGVIVDDAGRMVDEAIVRRARRLLDES